MANSSASNASSSDVSFRCNCWMTGAELSGPGSYPSRLFLASILSLRAFITCAATSPFPFLPISKTVSIGLKPLTRLSISSRFLSALSSSASFPAKSMLSSAIFASDRIAFDRLALSIDAEFRVRLYSFSPFAATDLSAIKSFSFFIRFTTCSTHCSMPFRGRHPTTTSSETLAWPSTLPRTSFLLRNSCRSSKYGTSACRTRL